MATSASTGARPKIESGVQVGTIPQSQPVLLPYNRKLRNLKSISLRHLDVSLTTPARSRGHTIDDDADPNAFASPTKLQALREERTLEYSHSSGDLRSEGITQASEHGSPKAKVHLNGVGTRKRPGRPRRRSTLDWTNASALRRQEKLEHVKQDRTYNVFYSLHVDGIEAPIYVSETAEQTMDPTFRSVDLSACDAGILRQNAVLVRLWTQSLSTGKWTLLREWHVQLQSLYFLGTDLDHTSLAYEKNTLLFQFSDGMYTLPNMAPSILIATTMSKNKLVRQSQRPTSSFDALLKLAKLTDSIEDALASRDRLAEQLEDLLLANKAALEQRDHVTEYQDRCKTIIFARDTVTKQIGKAKKQIAEKRVILQHRRKLLEDDQTQRQHMSEHIQADQEEIPHMRDDRLIRSTVIAAQRRRIVEDLQKIYPINSAGGGKALTFKIRELRLPNADELDSIPATEAAASLGYVAHVTQSLSSYLGVPLPYHLHIMGSTSWITDPISIINGTTGAVSSIANALRVVEDKVYPLHQSRVARFRFEYGVFLLNKDIQLLLENAFGVRVLDIRHTLPNLKYLFYVATAGEGELPARKAGGIRGLLKQSPRASLSRGNSSGSLTGWMSLNKEGKQVKGAAQSLRKLVQD